MWNQTTDFRKYRKRERLLCRTAARSGCFPAQKLFIEKTDQEPYKEVVQSDDALIIETGSAVVPWTDILLAQKGSEDIFSGHDKRRIDTSSDCTGEASDPTAYRKKKGSAAVDREHPYRSGSVQFHVSFSQGVESRPEYFQTPAGDSAH